MFISGIAFSLPTLLITFFLLSAIFRIIAKKSLKVVYNLITILVTSVWCGAYFSMRGFVASDIEKFVAIIAITSSVTLGAYLVFGKAVNKK